MTALGPEPFPMPFLVGSQTYQKYFHFDKAWSLLLIKAYHQDRGLYCPVQIMSMYTRNEGLVSPSVIVHLSTVDRIIQYVVF